MKSITSPSATVLGVGAAGMLLGFVVGALLTKKKKRIGGDGHSSATDDLRLFYAADAASLTTIDAEFKKLPADLYGKVR